MNEIIYTVLTIIFILGLLVSAILWSSALKAPYSVPSDLQLKLEPAGIRQPCSITKNNETDNLPTNYIAPGCGVNQRCVDDMYSGGPVCLSEIGGPCLTLRDCVGEATSCLNNVCETNESETLNQECYDFADCDIATGIRPGTSNPCSCNGAINFACQKQGKLQGVCKILALPDEINPCPDGKCIYGKCQKDSDCALGDTYNQLYCEIESEISINGIVEGFCRFKAEPGAIISGSVTNAKLLPPQIRRRQGIDSRGNPIFLKPPCVDGYSAERRNNEDNNLYCILDGKINGALGSLCYLDAEGDIDAQCESGLECLFSETEHQYYVNNQNRGTRINMGVCSKGSKKQYEECDFENNNCERPYLCLSLNNQYFCQLPYEKVNCYGGVCSTGYTCDLNSQKCIGEGGRPCLDLRNTGLLDFPVPSITNKNESQCKFGCGGLSKLYSYSEDKNWEIIQTLDKKYNNKSVVRNVEVDGSLITAFLSESEDEKLHQFTVIYQGKEIKHNFDIPKFKVDVYDLLLDRQGNVILIYGNQTNKHYYYSIYAEVIEFANVILLNQNFKFYGTNIFDLPYKLESVNSDNFEGKEELKDINKLNGLRSYPYFLTACDMINTYNDSKLAFGVLIPSVIPSDNFYSSTKNTEEIVKDSADLFEKMRKQETGVSTFIAFQYSVSEGIIIEQHITKFYTGNSDRTDVTGSLQYPVSLEFYKRESVTDSYILNVVYDDNNRKVMAIYKIKPAKDLVTDGDFLIDTIYDQPSWQMNYMAWRNMLPGKDLFKYKGTYASNTYYDAKSDSGNIVWTMSDMLLPEYLRGQSEDKIKKYLQADNMNYLFSKDYVSKTEELIRAENFSINENENRVTFDLVFKNIGVPSSGLFFMIGKAKEGVYIDYNLASTISNYPKDNANVVHNRDFLSGLHIIGPNFNANYKRYLAKMYWHYEVPQLYDLNLLDLKINRIYEIEMDVTGYQIYGLQQLYILGNVTDLTGSAFQKTYDGLFKLDLAQKSLQFPLNEGIPFNYSLKTTNGDIPTPFPGKSGVLSMLNGKLNLFGLECQKEQI